MNKVAIDSFIIIGAGGLVGSNLFSVLKERGYNVAVTTRKHGQIPGAIIYDIGLDDPKCLSAYVTKPEKTCAIISGGITNIGYCFSHKDEVKAVNVDGTIRILKFFHELGVRTMWFSSDQVFDGRKGNYSEDDEVNPLCVYGRSKVAVEEYILRHLPETLVYRISKQYSNTLKHKNLFSEIRSELESNGVVRNIQGLIYNPTYVIDTVECVIDGVLNQLSGIYHVASPQQVPRYDISKVFLGKLGVENDRNTQVPLESMTFLKELKALNTTLNTTKFDSKIHHVFRDYTDIIAASEDISKRNNA